MTYRGLHPKERVEEYVGRGWWTDETLDDLFRARVAAHPDRTAIADPANRRELVGTEPRRLTWRRLDAEVAALAAELLRHGLRQGQVLAVQLPNTIELATAYLACWRLGIVISPLPVQYREHEINRIREIVDVAAFFTIDRVGDRRLAAEAAATGLPVLAYGTDLPEGVTRLEPAPATPEQAETVAAYVAGHPIDPNDCATICWTSGTESMPKGVQRTHYDWIAISWNTIDAPGLTGDDVLLNPFPMVNMAGVNGMFLPWLRVGGLLVQHHPFDLPTFLRQLAEEKATYTVAPPPLLNLLLAKSELLAGTDISSLRVIGSGSAPLSPDMVRGWQERYGIGVINFFGSNEGVALLTTPRDVPDPEQRARYFPRYGVPGRTWSARTASQVTVKLVDLATGAEITEPGVPGELRIKGPMLFPGYVDGDRLPSPFDEEGFLKTGDVFRIAGENGEFLEYVDRAKDMVIRGGMNIAPAELENLLLGHPAIAEVAVVGVPDEVYGERVCAVVVPREGATVTLEDVTAFLKERKIASYKLPERLEIRSSLPRNPLGKLLKRRLRDELGGRT